MASITKQQIGKYTYVYESVSYRDEKERPRNKKTKIGKIDPDTGATVYLPKYFEKNKGTPALVNVYTTTEIPNMRI